MQPFAFEPALFDHRAEAQEALNRAGYEWPTHFSMIDALHDVFGLEVCGVPTECDACCIASVLRRTFPAWKHWNMWLPAPEDGHLDAGWVVFIHRDSQSQN